MSSKDRLSTLEKTRAHVRALADKAHLLDAEVTVLAKPLTPQEAIGEPGRRDFPIIVGKERVIEATLMGSKGHAFTDSAKEYVGSLAGVLDIELTSNQNRAVYVATINALMGRLEITDKTVHCKDEEPEDCAREIAQTLFERHGKVKIGLIGLNPAIAERLIDTFGTECVRITDLCRDVIGQERFGVEVWDGAARTEELIEFADVILFTGTTLVNNTFDAIRDCVAAHGKVGLVYGVTAAAVSRLFDIERICPCGRTA